MKTPLLPSRVAARGLNDRRFDVRDFEVIPHHVLFSPSADNPDFSRKLQVSKTSAVGFNLQRIVFGPFL